MDTIRLMQDAAASADGPRRDPAFFDQEYRPASIGIGFIWFFMTIINPILFAIIRPGRKCYLNYCDNNYLTKGEKHAWNVLKIANGLCFGFMTLFWLLSYIKNRNMYKLYFRAIERFIPVTWIFAIWALIAFIIGGTQDFGKIGKDIGYWFLTMIFLVGSEFLAYWFAPNMVKFYRWDPQEYRIWFRVVYN